MFHIHSSFNSDRIAACLLNKPPKKPTRKEIRIFTVYKDNELKVKTSRGAIKFMTTLPDKITSACCSNGQLTVMLADGSTITRKYNSVNGDFRPAAQRRARSPGARSRHEVPLVYFLLFFEIIETRGGNQICLFYLVLCWVWRLSFFAECLLSGHSR